MTGLLFTLFKGWESAYESALGDLAAPVAAIVDGIIYLVLIFVASKLFLKLLKRLLKRIFDRQIRKGKNPQRIQTVSNLSSYVATILVYFVAVCAVLSVIGLGNTVGSLLATAGIGGLAIGFGAQSLIKDFFSGIFLILEDQIAIGDFVSIAGETGTVEAIQLRTTTLRAMTGERHVIPNGEIAVVTNYSRGGVYAIIDVPMPYENTVDEVTAVLNQAMERLAADNGQLLEKPQVLGVVEFADSAVMLRITAKVKKLQQWAVERQARQYILEEFKKSGISVPYNKLELLHDKGDE